MKVWGKLQVKYGASQKCLNFKLKRFSLRPFEPTSVAGVKCWSASVCVSVRTIDYNHQSWVLPTHLILGQKLCLPTVACTVWLRHTLHASCALWQTSTHDDDCAPHRHLRSKCHRRVMLPSATVSLASPLRVYGTLCRPTSRHRHHCLSSSDISKLSFFTNSHVWHCH